MFIIRVMILCHVVANSHVSLLSKHASQSGEEASACFEEATGAVC